MQKLFLGDEAVPSIIFSVVGLLGTVVLAITKEQVFVIPVAVVAGLLSGIAIKNIYNMFRREERKVFLPSINSEFNFPFYEYFCEKINNTKREFLVSGEGFSYAGEEGKKIGIMYQEACVQAVKNGASVIRIQTIRNINSQFQKDLRKLLELGKDDSNKGNFRLHVITDQQAMDLASVCLIDYNDRKNALVELMLPFKDRVTSSDIEVSLAGVGIFVRGNLSLAKKVRERFFGIQKNRTTEVTSDNFDDFFGDRLLYFAYGSNMDQTQMGLRCPSAHKVGVAYKENHRLGFNRTGTIWWDEGVASIIPAYNERVYGVLYSVTATDMEKLDKDEDPIAYIREPILVKILGNEENEVSCYAYIAIPESCKTIPPNRKYLEKIINAAESAEIEPNYIYKLRQFSSVEGPPKKDPDKYTS